MSVKEILQQAGFRIISETAEFYRMKPLHRQSNTADCLSVNKKTGHWKDWGSQDAGPLEKLIKITTGGNIEFEPVSDSLRDLKEEIQVRFNKEEIKALLPSYSFYNKKGISSETLALFKGGFCQGGKLYNRFVFPILNPDGELVGLSGRTLLPKRDESWKKWKNLGPTKKWLYPLLWNADAIKEKREIILVESIGNMLALWEAGYKHTLVCSGTSLSKERLAAIISAAPNRIILAFDNDDGKVNAGQEGSRKIQNELNKWFDKSKICSKLTPTGQDLGDLWQHGGQTAIDQWYQ